MDPSTRADPRAARSRSLALEAGQRLLLTEGLTGVTHQRVAAEAGLGRRTLYRHWPDQRSLLHDVLALTRAPESEPGADLSRSIEQHLAALDAALNDGPLAYILAALFERSTSDPSYEALRAELSAAGRAPLERMLRAASRRGDLPARLDVELAVAMLEGPVVHAAIVRRRRLSASQRRTVVASVLTSPPLATRSGRRG